MAYALAEMGADIAICSRTEETLYALAQELEVSTGRNILPVVANAWHEQAIGDMFAQIDRAYGRLDVLINSVTGNAQSPPEAMPEQTWNQALQGIVTGMFLCCQAAYPMMSEQGSGSIINIASIYGMVAADQRIYGDSGLNSSVVYGTGKAAVLQLTRYLAAAWAPQGIRVNAITPGGVEDPGNDHPVFRPNYEGRTPMARMMKREEIRGPVIFLASDASSYVTGHNLVVDGGFTIV